MANFKAIPSSTATLTNPTITGGTITGATVGGITPAQQDLVANGDKATSTMTLNAFGSWTTGMTVVVPGLASFTIQVDGTPGDLDLQGLTEAQAKAAIDAYITTNSTLVSSATTGDSMALTAKAYGDTLNGTAVTGTLFTADGAMDGGRDSVSDDSLLPKLGLVNINLTPGEFAEDIVLLNASLATAGLGPATDAIFRKYYGYHTAEDYTMEDGVFRIWKKMLVSPGVYQYNVSLEVSTANTGGGCTSFDGFCVTGTSSIYDFKRPVMTAPGLNGGMFSIVSDVNDAEQPLLVLFKNTDDLVEQVRRWSSTASERIVLAERDSNGRPSSPGVLAAMTAVATDDTVNVLGVPACFGAPTGAPDARDTIGLRVDALTKKLYFTDYTLPTGGTITYPADATGGDDGYPRSGFVLHTFTESGDFAVTSPVTVHYALGAGGGGGGKHWGGGGGAGRIKTGTLELDAGTHSFVCGAGGAAQADGEDSTFGGVTCAGGGRGGADDVDLPAHWYDDRTGKPGGNGGGGAMGPVGETDGGASTDGGYAGGAGLNAGTSLYFGGGGGGNGEAGHDATGTQSGNGGDGISIDLPGGAVTKGGGGGGGAENSAYGQGGAGGGGAGGGSGQAATAGTANSSGGGGGSQDEATPGAGGSGFLYVWYQLRDVEKTWAEALDLSGV